MTSYASKISSGTSFRISDSKTFSKVVLAGIILISMTVLSTAYSDGFEDNDLSEWQVTDFQTVSDYTFDGSYAGYSNNGQYGINDYQAKFTVSGGNTNISFFEFYYRETGSGSYGGGLRLLDASGNEVFGLATDNSQWMRTDGNEEYQLYSGDGYQRWVRVNATLNWSDGTYKTGWKDLQSGNSTIAKNIPLASTSGVHEVWYQSFTTSTGSDYGWSYGSTHEMWLDNISYSIDPLSTNNAPEINLQTPSDTNKNPNSGITLEANISDRNNDEMNITFYDASDDSQIGKKENVGNGTYSTTWTGLSEDQTYDWYAEVTDGESTSTTGTVSFTTIGISLSWNDNSDNEEEFRIYSNASGTTQIIATVPVNTENADVYNSGLQFGKNTTYEVTSYNQYGESDNITGYITP